MFSPSRPTGLEKVAADDRVGRSEVVAPPKPTDLILAIGNGAFMGVAYIKVSDVPGFCM